MKSYETFGPMVLTEKNAYTINIKHTIKKPSCPSIQNINL